MQTQTGHLISDPVTVSVAVDNVILKKQLNNFWKSSKQTEAQISLNLDGSFITGNFSIC